MTPIDRYQSDLNKESFLEDEPQRLAVQHTQRLYDELIGNNNRGGLLDLFKKKRPAIKGLYLWGGTGRGKTYLMDCFYECLPFNEKYRVHYHRFMRDIHAELDKLKNIPDPLGTIARNLSDRVRVLCLDEFHVNDIGDAMIMRGLLHAMFKNDITLMTTSNIAINNLYAKGLQREHFLPAIALLNDYTEEVELGAGIDFRAQMLEKNGTYKVFSTSDNEDAGQRFLERHLAAIAPCTPKRNRQIEINKRLIDYEALADDVIWFDFGMLCNTPRSSHDYIEIAQMFNAVLLGNVIRMDESMDDAAKRFIHLIDAFYDHKVKLILSAQAEANELYSGKKLAFPFERAVSRLIEMDSPAYLRSTSIYNR